MSTPYAHHNPYSPQDLGADDDYQPVGCGWCLAHDHISRECPWKSQGHREPLIVRASLRAMGRHP